jgi:class 3 adenylate cyclase
VISEKERLSYLRRLRFPQPLEDEFQRHYFAQNRGFIRICLVAAAIPILLQAWYGWRRFGRVSPLHNPGSWHVLLLGLRVGVTFLPSAWRVFYPVAVGLAVMESLILGIPGFGLIAAAYNAPGTVGDIDRLLSNRLAGIFLWHLLFGLAFRLPARWMVLYLATEGLLVRQALAYSGLPPETVVLTAVTSLTVPALVYWLIAYHHERTARAEFIASRLLAEERDRSERLLLNVLPAPIADRLKAAPGTIADTHPEVSVLFADIVDFTPLSARLSPTTTVDLLNAIFSRFDALARQHGIEKIKTVGDAYMAVSGLPTARPDHLDALARMALEMQTAMEEFSQLGHGPIRLRIGLHTGLAVAGVIGTTKFAYDLWGDTVNTASRLESHGVPGKIQVSAAVAEKLRDQFRFTHRGPVEMKGCGRVDTYFVEGELIPGEPAVLAARSGGEGPLRPVPADDPAGVAADGSPS